MIEDYLSNKNESATVLKTKKFSELNKALVHQKLFKILYHIKSCDTCMKH